MTIKTPQEYLSSTSWLDVDNPDIDGYVNSLNKSSSHSYDLKQALKDWNTA